MLMFATAASGAGIVAFRAASNRVREIAAEIRNQREDRPG
jgi:hypothetical protein